MNNRGSVTVEMCFVAPVLVGVVIMTIYMFTIDINKSVGWREACLLTYGKFAGDEEGDTKGRESQAKKKLDHELMFTEKAQAEMNIQEAEGICIGSYSAVICYTEEIRVAAWFGAGDRISRELLSKREVRDTAGNLRRWQNYGELLSD